MAGKAQSGKFADRYPGAKPIGGGEMIQWTKVGQEVVGEFVNVKPFKNGHIANVITEDGLVAFSAPTMLAGALEQIEKGSKIAIVFASEKANKGKGPDGRPLSPTKLFEVYQLEE